MLKINACNDMFVAIEESTDDNSIIWKSDSAYSENELSKILFNKGFDQREIQEAFIQAKPSYFNVGKW